MFMACRKSILSFLRKFYRRTTMARATTRRRRLIRPHHIILTVIMIYLVGWKIYKIMYPQEYRHSPFKEDDYEQTHKLDRGYQHAELRDLLEEEDAQWESYGMTTDPTSTNLKTILLWTSFYENPDFYFGFGQQPFISNKCPVHNCETIRDKNKLNESHAVLFHGPRIEEVEYKPTYRPNDQIYIMFQTEPHYYPSVAYLPQYHDMFNYTMASKRDADAFIAYGWVLPSRYGKKIRKGVVANPLNKPKDIVWLVSHCDTLGRREWYVEELAKHIHVDIYGSCGNLSCPIGDPCLDKFEMEYKFYLALENSFCADYVTEKMYRTMTYDIIPIVFGGANYTLDAPPHSVINILDFPRPADLAEYLRYLSTNITAYDEYFEWKRHYKIQHFRHRIFGQAFCKMCEDLNNPDYVYRDYSDIASWWLNDICDMDVIPRIRQKHGW